MSTITTTITTQSAPSSPMTSPPKAVQVNIANLLAPAFTSSLYLVQALQQVIRTTTFFLLFRSYILSGLLLRQLLSLSLIVLIQSFYASCLVCRKSGKAASLGWSLSWKALQPLRKKIAYEVWTTLLGGGNGLILVIFWPGWILVWGGMGLWFVLG
ncbi:hypothetical protein F5884DRAFT_391591 [Xylogone sp. PMI_703]|nr:hypothetical protein F5884DRAFT_391591 [Xylogone sp. PMI_703]